jgi:hypothetical protein
VAAKSKLNQTPSVPQQSAVPLPTKKFAAAYGLHPCTVWRAVRDGVGSTLSEEMLAAAPTRRNPTPSIIPYVFQDLCIGNQLSSSNVKGKIAACALWPRALTDAEYKKAVSTMAYDISGSGITLSSRRFWLAMGDSITQGSETGNVSYVTLYAPVSSPKLVATNFGAAGTKLDYQQTTYASYGLSGCVVNRASGDVNVLSIMIGTNELYFGFTGGSQASFLTGYSTLLNQMRADGWIVIVCTIISGNEGGITDAGLAPLNTEIRKWATAGTRHCA